MQNRFLSIVFSRTSFKRAFQGAGLGILLLLIFLSLVGAINDGSWVFLAMLTVAIAGACGGAFYHLVSQVPIERGWKRSLANLVCLLVYLVGLWMGLVYALSLVGLWD
ncbi:MAG: potassium transporter KefB [Bacteroidota bacterium]|nr:potassium transporter KefB [Bacteroidota bacterium]